MSAKSVRLVSSDRLEAIDLMNDVHEAIQRGIDRTQSLLDQARSEIEVKSIIINNGGWLKFWSDESRTYDGLAVKVETKVIQNVNHLDRFQVSIEVNSTNGEGYLVKVLPTITKDRLMCLDCTLSLVTKLSDKGFNGSGDGYDVNVTGISGNCQVCGETAQAGTMSLVTVTYHVALPKVAVPREASDDLPDMHLRGHVGKVGEVTAEQVVTYVQGLRTLVTENKSLRLTPVRARHQHDGHVATALNIWDSDGTHPVIKRNKKVLADLTL